MDYYPDNKISQFVTQLPQPIRLEGQWEVGLVEIIYPHTWFNIPHREEDRTFTVQAPDPTRPGHYVGYTFILPKGFYTIETLLLRIEDKANRVLNLTTNERVRLSYDPVTRVVSSDLNDLALYVPEAMKSMFGITFDAFNPRRNQSDTVIDMDPLNSLYIYCDLVEPRVVGDTSVPLLRVTPAEGKHGEMVCKTYENVHYIPVQRKQFQTLEIYIRDDTGHRVPFECGKSIVTLHFRRKPTIL